MIHELISLERDLVCFDTETTGVYAQRDRIVQLGVIRVYADGRVREGSQLINPGIPIPPAATEVHGITDEMVKDQPKFADLAPTLFNGFSNADLAGFNVHFDVQFITHEFKRCGLDFKPGRLVDGWRIFTKYERRDLTSAVKFYLNEDLENAHDGLADARASLRVIKAQLERYPDLPRNLDELHKEFFEKKDSRYVDQGGKIAWKEKVAVINFGKWSGTPLTDVPTHYLKWIVANEFPDDTKRICQDAINGKFPEFPVQ